MTEEELQEVGRQIVTAIWTNGIWAKATTQRVGAEAVKAVDAVRPPQLARPVPTFAEVETWLHGNMKYGARLGHTVIDALVHFGNFKATDPDAAAKEKAWEHANATGPMTGIYKTADEFWDACVSEPVREFWRREVATNTL